MTRPARVVIDLASLQHNLSRVRELAPASKVMAIIKADAYGHGLVRIATALRSVDGFGVACLEEAQQLRAAGLRQAVVLLEGPYSTSELTQIQALGLDIVVHHSRQVEMLEQAALPAPIRVWLKIDSGMHRLGFDPDSLQPIWQRLHACPSVSHSVRLMTHLATANERSNPMTERQLQLFKQACRGLEGERSVANSAAVIAWPASHADWVRPGLMLYGVSPMRDSSAGDHNLRPVMTLMSELISVKTVKQGETVGYGAGWSCPETMIIGIVAAGYGDGFPRHAQSGTPVLVNGQRATIIGNPSMDMLTLDLRTIRQPRVGDPVELWGQHLPIEEVAQHAGTIPYELLCGVHKRLSVIEHGKG
ncbi:MAG: alanine racemase [Gammaproteobacteria bacterium]